MNRTFACASSGKVLSFKKRSTNKDLDKADEESGKERTETLAEDTAEAALLSSDARDQENAEPPPPAQDAAMEVLQCHVNLSTGVVLHVGCCAVACMLLCMHAALAGHAGRTSIC